MRSFPALRLGGQVFCCVGVLSFFSPFCLDLRFFWLLAALIFAVTFAAARLSRALARLGLALIPGLAFFVPLSGWISAAAGGAIGLYAAIILTRGDFYPDYRSYRLEGAWTLAICGLFLIISFFWSSSGISSFWLLICAVLLVLLALRLLQMEGTMGLAWQAGSIGMLGAVLAVGIVVGLTLWFLHTAIIDFLMLIATGFAWLAAQVLTLLSWVANVYVHFMGMNEDPFKGDITDVFQMSEPNDHPSSQGSVHPNVRPISIDVPWMPILTVVVAALLIYAAVRIIRSGALRRFRRRPYRNANVILAEEPRPRRKKVRETQMDNRSRLRFIYSLYLDYLRMRGVNFDSTRTTEEITEASSDLFLQTDERLRRLYRKARYSREDITDDDVNAARALYDSLIADENQRRRALRTPGITP